MFERWITRRHDRTRLEGSVLCRQLLSFAETLESEGYQPLTLRRYMFAAAAFGRWIDRQGWTIEDVDESRWQRYLTGRRRHRHRARRHGRLSNSVSGVHKFVTVLRVCGAMPAMTIREPGPIDEVVAAFDSHLARVAGLAVGTRRVYRLYARALLVARFGTARPEWRALDAECVSEFVQAQTDRLHASSRRMPVKATRAFLRFLVGQGLVGDGLAGAVPTVRTWKHASLPHYISTEQVTRTIVGCSAVTPVGLRDRAILAMLAGFGIRACELAALRLDDIHWREAVVLVRGAKSRRERVLPLTTDVGAAVAAYLRDGRHRSERREVFLAAHAPYHPLTPSAVSAIVARALIRAGVPAARRGAHVFRHTAATLMARSGATFKQIADILGHASIGTTTIYAKLDVEALARVALPWPEAAS